MGAIAHLVICDVFPNLNLGSESTEEITKRESEREKEEEEEEKKEIPECKSCDGKSTLTQSFLFSFDQAISLSKLKSG